MSYKAFISYSHAADNQLAPTLQSALQRFAKPFYRLRAMNVFRDKTSLHLTPKLWPLIQQALRESEYFILLASPDAAGSQWVQAEVDEWLKLKNGSPDEFLIVLTDGEILWDRSRNDFDWDKTTALPISLRGKFATEPLFSDLRWAKKNTDLSLRHPQFLDDIGTIGATLHGKPKDVMIGKDVRQHRVFKLATGAAILVLLISFLATSVAAYYANQQSKEAVRQRDEAQRQKNEADHQRQVAVEAADKERAARKEATTARDKETEQRKKAEDATKNEKAARQSAEERRVEAEHQRNVAEEQRQLAEEKSKLALSRQLTAQASNHLDDQFDLSLLLGVEAYRANATYEARRTLLTGLEHNPQLVTYLSGHNSAVHGLVFSPDGRTLISAGIDSTIRLWDAATGRPLGKFLTGDSRGIWSLALSPDGKTLASGGDASLILWDITSEHPQPRHLKFSIDTAESLAFSPDGRTLACGTSYHGITLWDVQTGQRKGEALTKHKGQVWSLAFSPDGKTLASGSEDQTIILWDLETGQPRGLPLTGQGLDGIGSIAFSRDGKTLASADSGKILLWNVATRTQRLALSAPAWLRSLAFGADDKTLVAGGNDGYLEEWWDTGGKVPETKTLNLGNKTVWIVTFSPDGETFASGSDDGTVILWGRPSRSGRIVRRLNEPSISDVAFNPDGKILALGNSNKIKLLNTTTGQVTNEILGHVPFAFSPDGAIVASADSGKIVLLSVATGLPLGSPLTDHESNALAFSPNGKILASIGCQESGYRCVHNEIFLWDVTTRQQLGQSIVDDGPLKALAFSADSRTLAYVNYESENLVLLDVATRKIVWSEPGLSVAFSPDGQTMASGGHDTIFLWDTATHRRRHQFPLQKRNAREIIYVERLAFSSDGKMLLSTADVGSILWDVATRQPVWSSTWVSGAVTLSPAGNAVATVDMGGTVTLWDFVMQSWETRTCRVANRNLSWEEWGQYLSDQPYHKTCEDLPIHPSFLDEGRKLATEGEFRGAVTMLRKALQIEPSLKFDAEVEARRHEAIGKEKKLLTQVYMLLLTKEREIKTAMTIYRNAVAAHKNTIKFGPTPELSNPFAEVCRQGTLRGYASEIMDACERAVAVDPQNWHSRDSRGLARALTGNFRGAIEDFEEFIKGTWYEEESAQRQRWIDALRSGNNPFTPEELNRVLTHN